jgi:hypothetical protein
MNLVQCLVAAALTMAVVWTVYGLIDRWNTVVVSSVSPASTEEPFSDAEGPKDLPRPSDSDAIQAHKTLLQYTQANPSKGTAIVAAIAQEFYGPGLTVRKDLDPEALLANYNNPLQGP